MSATRRVNPTGRVLAVASGGGHWVQLMRLRPAWHGMDEAYISVSDDVRAEVSPARFYLVPHATRWDRWKLLFLLARVAWICLRERPRLVVSTGAAPGLVAVVAGKLCGARTVWVDSAANVERMSMSGRLVRPFADLWLTQWEHLSAPAGPRFEGSVL